jgi:hypothetical protein
MAIHRLDRQAQPTEQSPFVDYKGAIRAYWRDWRDLEKHEGDIARAIALWISSAKPGSGEKRMYLMFRAGILLVTCRLNAINDPEWFIDALTKEINDV